MTQDGKQYIPIYGKNPVKIFFSRTRKLTTLGFGAYQICSNDDPRLTLIYLTSRSNLLPNGYEIGFFLKSFNFNTVEAKFIILNWMLNLMR